MILLLQDDNFYVIYERIFIYPCDNEGIYEVELNTWVVIFTCGKFYCLNCYNVVIWSISLWERADCGVRRVDFIVLNVWGWIDRRYVIVLDICYSTIFNHFLVISFYYYVGYWYALYNLLELVFPLFPRFSILTPKYFNNF